MPAIKELATDLAEVRAKATAILEDGADALTAERRVEFDGLMTRAGELKTAIETAHADEERKTQLQSTIEFLERPQYRVPRGVGNTEPETKQALLAGGWEVKNGIVFAPTSQGTMVEMFAEEVLHGDIPTDDVQTSNYFKSVRAAFQPEYRAAYVHFLRSAVKTRSESVAFSMLSPSEQKALSEGTDTAGGFLVPPDVQAEMLVRLPQKSVMRRFARVVTTSRDEIRFPAAKAATTNGSIYSNGFVGSWAGETPAFSDTDPAFQQFSVPVKKLRVATKLSNDFVADATINVLAWLAQEGASNMGLTEDSGFITGDGTALQPLGILNSGLTTVDVEGSTTNTISNTLSNAGSAPKLLDVEYAVPPQYLSGAAWLMCRSIEGKIRKLTDAMGRFLWLPMAGSGYAGTPGNIDGYPVATTDWMPNDGTDGNKVVLFGDLSQYIIAQRAQITSVVLRERFADVDQVGIILWERVGGAMWNTDAARIGIV